MTEPTKRVKEVVHDETPSAITSHPFEPKSEWWSLCKHCDLAESAHVKTTNLPFRIVTNARKIFPR